MSNYDSIPDELKSLPQWVCVSEDSKLPMKSWENEPASSTKPDTWATYEEALYSVTHSFYDYLGFVFNDNGIVGIDIDKGFDEDGFINQMTADIISKCRSYTELSRSGRGFHILVKGTLPFKGRNNLQGIEIYKQSRYFIMTGRQTLYSTMIENQEAIDYIVSKYFPETREKKEQEFDKCRIYQPIWEEPIKNGRIKLRPTYPPIPDGCRNISLTSLAGSLHNIGYTRLQIYNELVYVNKVACNPPLPDRELQTICNSVTRYEK